MFAYFEFRNNVFDSIVVAGSVSRRQRVFVVEIDKFRVAKGVLFPEAWIFVSKVSETIEGGGQVTVFAREGQ